MHQAQDVPYEEPDSFDNLDEVAIDPPIDRERSKLHGSYFEGRERGGRNHDDAAVEMTQIGTSQREPGTSRQSSRGSQSFTGQQERSNIVKKHASDESSANFPSSERTLERTTDEAQYVTLPPARPQSTASRFQTELYAISHLIFFSILGTAARCGIQWLTFYPDAVVLTPVLWANVGGSLALGFLVEDQRLFRDSFGGCEGARSRTMQVKKTVPLYIGLSVGFCGSFTSFSSFMRDAFLAISNNLPSADGVTGRNGGYSFEALLAVLITTIGLSLGALFVGAHLAILLDPIVPRLPHQRKSTFHIDHAAVFLGWGCWLGAVFLAIWPPHETWRGRVVFALVFAPMGCLLRFYISLKLNAVIASFPLGTFVVNVVGTTVEGMCYDLQHVSIGTLAGGGVVGCQVLQGIQDGYCGALTTVSTWVAELDGLRLKHAYAYAAATVVGGVSIMIVIMGSVRWSTGWIIPACDTGYADKY